MTRPAFPRLFAAIILMLICAPLPACQRGMIHVDAIDEALQPVLTVHDRYVSTDPELDQREREILLRNTEGVRMILDAASPDDQ